MTDTALGMENRATLGMLARVWRARLVVHTALFAGVLFVALSLVAPATPFTPDESVYGSQVLALEDGSWAYELPAETPKPGELQYPYNWDQDDAGRPVPYARHPSYPVLLWLVSLVTGANGWLIITSLIGAVVMAAGAWKLAELAAPGDERWAFWLTAASPVAFNGLVLWGHTLVGAAAVWALVFGARAALGAEGRVVWAACAACVAAGVLVRSEGLLVAAAIALGLAAVGALRRSRRALLGAAIVGAAAACALGVERLVVEAIAASPDSLAARGATEGVAEYDLLAGRWHAFLHSILGGSHYRDGANTAGRIGLALTCVAGLLAYRGRRSAGLRVAIAAVALLILRVAATPEDPLPGLFVAWPVAVIGAVAAARALLRRDEHVLTLLAVVIGAFCAATLATQYSDGGSLQWGGRFFTPAIPLLAVLVCAWSRHDDARRSWRPAILVLAAVLAVTGVFALRSTRVEHRELIELVADQNAALNVSHFRTVPRSMWRHPALGWRLVERDELEAVLETAAARGVDHLVLVWREGAPVSAAGWDVEVLGARSYDTFPFEVVSLAR